jgi:hypothetical protein
MKSSFYQLSQEKFLSMTTAEKELLKESVHSERLRGLVVFVILFLLGIVYSFVTIKGDNIQFLFSMNHEYIHGRPLSFCLMSIFFCAALYEFIFISVLNFFLKRGYGFLNAFDI